MKPCRLTLLLATEVLSLSVVLYQVGQVLGEEEILELSITRLNNILASSDSPTVHGDPREPLLEVSNGFILLKLTS